MTTASEASSLSAPAVLVERRGPALLLTLNRPERMNALSRDIVAALEEALAAAADDLSVRAVVLAGTGERAFCTGADLKERAAMTPAEAGAFVQRLRALMSQLGDLPCPTIAAIEGFALGGGLELALACDMRVVGEMARLGLPEVRLGIVPGAGGTQRLARVVGLARAKELTMTGRRVDAQEAATIGLANDVVAAGMAVDRALAIVDDIALGAPIAVREAKRAIDGGFDRPLSEALRWEQAAYDVVLGTEDRVEALRAFAEKRPPRFEGR